MHPQRRNRAQLAYLFASVILLAGLCSASPLYALSSANIPLDSPIYAYLEKLAGFGLITSDIRGIRPFSKAEAARLMLEAEKNLAKNGNTAPSFAGDLVARIRELLPRESALRSQPETKPELIDYNQIASVRLRYVYQNGVPRSYERQVHDPGGDGVFGIGSGLRPTTPGAVSQQHGSEGTPLAENNSGTVYRKGHNAELRWAGEAYISDKVAGLVEPAVVFSTDKSTAKVTLNRGYVKIGGGALELEGGKDENWLGLGNRGAITLTNNAENFTQVKLSSPEPFEVGWLSWLGAMKYTVIGSRFDKTTVSGKERQPWFYAVKLSTKPTENLEIGLNIGHQQGGPGVKNSIGDTLRGIFGGTGADNSNGMAGFEIRYRIPWLRNIELYGEFSGEDSATFWPIVESYLAGFYIPRLTDEGRDDLRFEFFQGNQILYTNDTFPQGYIYRGMPIGHSQGGATQDFFVRYSHWFGVRSNLAFEYIYTNRGMASRVPGQAIERKNAGRISWDLPLFETVDTKLLYGIERINNLNLVDGVYRTNQLATIEFRYNY